jgi:hypothetical protein
MCRRDVRVAAPSNGDIPSWGGLKTFVVNSTQYCFQQLDTQPGSPKNTQILDLQLNRFQWSMMTKTIGANQYPILDVTVFPDFDEPTPILKLTLQLVNFVLRNAQGGIISSTPLDTVAFTTCTEGAGCSNEMPYPAVSRMDYSKQIAFNLTGVINNSIRLSLGFTVTDDFAEDADVDHIFLRPSAIKVDVSVQMPAPAQPTFVDLEAIVYAPKTGAASHVYPAVITPARLPVEYDPKLMSRAVIGDPTDAVQGYVSWWSSMDTDTLCITPGAGSTCVMGAAPVEACPNGQYTAQCAAAKQDTTTSVTGWLLKWTFQQDAATWDGGRADWYFNLGYTDPAEITDPGSAMGTAGSLLFVVLAVIIMVTM